VKGSALEGIQPHAFAQAPLTRKAQTFEVEMAEISPLLTLQGPPRLPPAPPPPPPSSLHPGTLPGTPAFGARSLHTRLACSPAPAAAGRPCRSGHRSPPARFDDGGFVDQGARGSCRRAALPVGVSRGPIARFDGVLWIRAQEAAVGVQHDELS
jgi:hypothetical protein